MFSDLLKMKPLVPIIWSCLIGLPAAAQILPERLVPLEIGNSFRIHPGNVTQSEVFIARHPANEQIIAVACNAINFVPFFISEGNYATVDGGLTWYGSDTCNGNPISFHGGDPGITIDKDGTFILTHLGRAPFVGLYSNYSTDNGLTWSDQRVISTDDLERAAVASDAIPGSAFYGRTYAVWTKLAQPFHLMFASTDNHAQLWSTPRQVNNPVLRSAGGEVAVGPGGGLYACWAGVTGSPPFKEVQVGFAASTDGGANWNVTEQAFAVNGITGVLPEKGNIRVNGLPMMAVDTTQGPRSGWIYIVTGQKDLPPAGTDPDIILYRSADGGATWSAGIRVNQDPLNDGKIQYFPNIHVDRFGAVNVIFYDDRTTTSDSAGVFLARSEDGGDSWREFEICDHHFRPQPIGGLGQGYQGDVIDLTSTSARLWPVWMDNSTGIYQVWTVPVDFADVGIESGNHVPVDLLKCYPNPFPDKIVIEYLVPEPGPVSLEILDLFGRRLELLVNEWKPVGIYKMIFTPPLPGSQRYLCRILTARQAEIRSLVLSR